MVKTAEMNVKHFPAVFRGILSKTYGIKASAAKLLFHWRVSSEGGAARLSRPRKRTGKSAHPTEF